MSILDMIKRHGDSAGDPDETSPNGKLEPVSVEANDQPHDGPDTAPPPARDETGAWDLIELGKRPGETGEAARDFGAAVDELRGTATEFSIGAARSAVSVGVIGNEVERLQGQLEHLAKRADSLQGLSEHASVTANESSDVASSLAEEAERGLAVVARVIDAIGELQEQSVRVADLLDGLVRRELADIGTFSTLIDGVARQTKLLALNAAIEAARAGEHGRGFAVVAGEVGRLATETEEQTAQIHETIERTRREMEGIQRAAEAARDQASQSVADTDEGRGALERIGTLVGQSRESAVQMAADATRQLTGGEEVASDLRDITAAIGEIGERSSAVSSHQVDLSASTERASRALSRFHTGGTIDRLQKLCRGLGDELREILEQAVDGRRVTLDKLLALDYRELKGSQIHALQSLFDSAASRAVALTHRSSRRPTTGSSTPR